ncbi:MAG: N-acetylglucosamine-6-phosphate deacetylase [Anaerolineaceae bacterium]|nr:N-acetylglucosamine-6-phosphate deacetylase [Anaerolineaceae bacterium]
MKQTPQQLLIRGARIFTPDRILEDAWLLIHDHAIHSFGTGNIPANDETIKRREIDAGGLMLLPGMIDIHVHGALGHEAMDASVEGLYEISRYFAHFGVTSLLPTTWTAATSTLSQSIQAIKTALGPVPDGATILGAHLEGPYLNIERCGAQDPALIKTASPDEILPLLDSGVVRLITLAPEIPQNQWLIEECVRRNITVSAGHTSANYEEMLRAIELGVRQTTHTFNAMTGIHHREPGTAGAALSNDNLSCELIADKIHLHPALIRIILRSKTPDRLILVTDSIRSAGLPDGEYMLDDRLIIMQGGAARLENGTLAGSTLTMNRALQNLVEISGISLHEGLKCATINPARSIGVANRKGSIEVGKDADLILMEDNFDIKMTIAEGKIVCS